MVNKSRNGPTSHDDTKDGGDSDDTDGTGIINGKQCEYTIQIKIKQNVKYECKKKKSKGKK